MTAILISGALWYAALPPAPLELAVTTDDPAPVRGVIHVHTERSDGSGTREEIAAAAARAGLQFVILTDHGDGTRRPDPPSYLGNVLCLDGVEISTNAGHLVALGLPQTPYPLGGEARDVADDVRRLGGMSIAAHPDSPRDALRWTQWSTRVDGLEWINVDSGWRDETWGTLARALLTYPARGAASVTSVLDRPTTLLARWDVLTQGGPIVGLAASDAHARLGTAENPLRHPLALNLPSYERTFRTLSLALPDVRLTGAAAEDGRVVLDAIRQGHVYSTIDGMATPARMRVDARSGSGRAVGGDRLPIEGPIEIRVETNAPAGSQTVLIQNGREVAAAGGPVLAFTGPPERAVYRAEVRLATAPGSPPVPWVVSNPVYVGMRPAVVPQIPSPNGPVRALYSDGSVSTWRIEKNTRSEGRIDVVPSVGGTQLTLRYGLGGTRSESPYVAAVVPTGGALEGMTYLTFSGRATRPMRLSVQLRSSDGGARRWRRSVYLDEQSQLVRLAFDEMSPIAPATGRPDMPALGDLLFVVDTVNATPGSSGQIWLDDIAVGRAATASGPDRQ